MERKKAHLNKKYNKARPKTPLLNKRQISFNIYIYGFRDGKHVN